MAGVAQPEFFQVQTARQQYARDLPKSSEVKGGQVQIQVQMLPHLVAVKGRGEVRSGSHGSFTQLL
jgi:hypothetical protein